MSRGRVLRFLLPERDLYKRGRRKGKKKVRNLVTVAGAPGEKRREKEKEGRSDIVDSREKIKTHPH